MIDSRVLGDLLAPADPAGRFHGVAVGMVTNNLDPEGLGRVKLCFPWLAEGAESSWARVVAPGAGLDRGVYFLPDVGDEVLVVFEHGHIDFPVVLGSLWNGVDTPPETNDGLNNLRTIKSRSGHTVRFDDTPGAEKIEIVDSTGLNSVTVDAVLGSITVNAVAGITLQSAGPLTLSGAGVDIQSTAGVTINAAATVDVTAGPGVNVTGGVINLN